MHEFSARNSLPATHYQEFTEEPWQSMIIGLLEERRESVCQLETIVSFRSSENVLVNKRKTIKLIRWPNNPLDLDRKFE